VRGDDLPIAIALMVMDHAVNCGPSVSARILQQAIGLRGEDVDGWIGPETVAAVATADPHTLIGRLNSGQAGYYRACRGFAEFGRGWLLRLARRQAAALRLLTGAATLTTDELNQQQLTQIS
jgi:lysozyme family protein